MTPFAHRAWFEERVLAMDANVADQWGCLVTEAERRTVLFMERKSVDVIKAKRAAHVEDGRDREEVTGCLGQHNSTVSSLLKGKF